VNIITGAGATGASLVNHSGVQKVAFTGSTDVGKRIASSVAGSGKRVTLELAGSEPFFRMSDRFFFRGSGRIDLLLRKIHVLPDYEKTNREMALSLLSSDSFDVFHPTYYDDYFLANVKKPFVVTVFDMTHEIFPSFFPGQETFLRQKKVLAERAAGIIAISSTTRDDLCEAYGLDPKKVQVSHLGGPAPTPVARGRGSHILYVGQRSIYKNFFRIEAVGFAQVVTCC
jgi:hypothetical protein